MRRAIVACLVLVVLVLACGVRPESVIDAPQVELRYTCWATDWSFHCCPDYTDGHTSPHSSYCLRECKLNCSTCFAGALRNMCLLECHCALSD